MASGPPSQPVKGPAKNGVNPPNARRHQLGKIGKHSRPDDRNTIILPGVDVEADLEAIRNNRAEWRPEINRYEVNGRLWGIEPNGTAFPDSGPGLIPLDRAQYKALKQLIQAGRPVGEWPPSYGHDPRTSKSDWQKAAEVYRYHPRSDQGEW